MKISEKKTIEKYTIYAGLNDKDTNEQKYITDRVTALITGISNGYKSPLTCQTGSGTYFSEMGTQVNENSLVITLVDTSEELVNEIAADICAFLNQETVMITVEKIERYFLQETIGVRSEE